jgi:hypothetical protein
VSSKTLSGRGIDSKFMLLADDTSLAADGADTTRVVLRVTDAFGNIRPYANDPIVLKLARRADRRQPFALVGALGLSRFAKEAGWSSEPDGDTSAARIAEGRNSLGECAGGDALTSD